MALSHRIQTLIAQAVVERRYGFMSPSSYAPVIALTRIFPEAKAEADAVERHLDDLDAHAEDPVARFERLTGRAFPQLPRNGSDDATTTKADQSERGYGLR